MTVSWRRAGPTFEDEASPATRYLKRCVGGFGEGGGVVKKKACGVREARATQAGMCGLA